MDIADTIPFKSTKLTSFALSKACNSELYCMVSQSKAYITELIYSHHNDERIGAEQSSLTELTTFKPSYGIPKNAPNIFNRATREEKERLLVDSQLMSEEMLVGNERIALTQAHWSPFVRHLDGDYYLAYLTNFGGCEIRAKNAGKRSWSFTRHDISMAWMLECQKTIQFVLNSFEAVEKAVNSIKITAIGWNDINNPSGHPLLGVFTACGTFVVFEIGEEQNIVFHKQLNRTQIQLMQWFSIRDKFNRRCSFVIGSELSGAVRLYSVQFDDQDKEIIDIEEKLCLFDEADCVFGNGIHWEYHEQSNRILIIFAKGMHIFASLIGLDNEQVTLDTSVNHYIGHMTINAITRMGSLEYIVGTMSGHLEKIQFDIVTNGSLHIRTELVKPPNGQTKYSVQGLAASRNSGLLLIAYYAKHNFDHLILREPAHIAVCHYIDGVQALKNLMQPTAYNLATQQDLALLIQNIQMSNDTVFQSYLATYPSAMDYTDAYIHELKVRLIVISARCTFLKSKNRLIESGNLMAEYGFLASMISAARAYRMLKHLSGKKKKLTDFQRLVIVCNRAVLRSFVSSSIFDEYDAIKMPFHSSIEEMLAKTEDCIRSTDELCIYCEEPVDQRTRVCSDGHVMPRCCISSIQLPLMQHRQCRKCQIYAMDDRDKLNEILSKDLQISDDRWCPLCDAYMESPQKSFAISFQ